MGIYNPHAPYILGEEWVPIRQADYQPDDITERGYAFHIDHAATIVSGVFNIASAAPTLSAAHVLAVYPAGTEDLTGPIKQLIIPVSSFSTTGGAACDPSGSTGCLTTYADGKTLLGLGGALFDVGVSFDVLSYSQQLFGKRILALDLLYQVSGTPDAIDAASVQLARWSNLAGGYAYGADFKTDRPGSTLATANFFPMTDQNPFWQTGVTSTSSPIQKRIYPWRYEELANLAATAGADRLIIRVSANLSSLPNDFIALGYLGLRVTYCEEKRVLYGGYFLNGNSTSDDQYYPDSGPVFVQLRTPALALPGSQAAGEYSVTQTFRDLSHSSSPVPPFVRAIRELYQLPGQQGFKLNYGTLDVDTEFTREDSAILPQLTLQTAAAVVTGTHPYGVVQGAPVYGTITAIQEIEDDPAGVSKQYPQVRFYARRFGNTTAPLRLVDVATGLISVTITPAEFDALPEIVDGWKEVNLTFTAPPSFATAAGDVDWRWDSVGEVGSNQWQVLSAGGPSPTGAQSVGPASYWAPLGDTVNLTWQTPSISGTAADTLSDAVLIFSTDPPTVTGFALSACSQTVTGVSYECGVPRACIATGISGNLISWDNDVVCDSFTRDLSASWGNASETGQAWTNSGGAASDYNVTLGTGTHTLTGTATAHISYATLGRDDQDVQAGPVVIPAVPTGATIEAGILGRRNSVSGDWYSANLSISTAGVATVQLTRSVSGTITTLGSIAMPHAHTPGTQYYLRLSVIGSIIKAKAWTAADPEPDWMVTVTDTSTATGGDAGVRSIRNTGNTNGTVIITFDNFQAVPAAMAGGRYEIQRWDEADGFWSTILDTANLCVTGMCDLEARVGVQSIYRMRNRNVLDFAGPWVSGAATLASPGVATAGNGNSTLIFTSNQAPLASLAYTMQWEGTPVEQFAFPEAEWVQLQRMYGKDFFTAFRPLERGGERFSRTLLVSAAAITPESLANFKGLRDLAWADLPYVCVRDELGNRWYATVLVPSGDVRRDRTLYFANIEVIDVTNTPSPLDP